MATAEAFADDVGPREFIEDHLEALFEPYAEYYEKVSDVEIVARLRLAGDGGEWTLIVSDTGLEVEEGRTATPLVTLIGDAEAWPSLRKPLGALVAAAERSARKHGDDFEVPDHRRLTNERLNRLEGVQGWVQVTFKNVPGATRDAELQVVFNADKPSGNPLKVDVDVQALLDAAAQNRRVSSLVKEGKIKVGGDMGLSVRLMAAVA